MQLGTSHSRYPRPRCSAAPPQLAACVCPPRLARERQSPDWRSPKSPRCSLSQSPASATSVSCLGGLCVSALSLNSQLSTLNSEPLAANSAQSSCFHNLPHSATTSQNSPLCFHNLTNPFSRSPFILITLQIARGVPALSLPKGHPPRSTGTLVAFVSTACAKHLKRIHLRRAVLTAQRRFSTVSRPMEKRCEFSL